MPTNAYDTYLAAESAGTLNTSLEAFYPFSFIATVAPITGAQASTTPQVLGEAGTLKNLYASLTSTTGSGKTQAFTVMNGLISASSPALASSTLACTVSNGTTCNDTTDSASVSGGNLIDLANTPTGTPGGAQYGAGVDFVPSISGDFDLLYSNNTSVGSNTTRYLNPSGTTLALSSCRSLFVGDNECHDSDINLRVDRQRTNWHAKPRIYGDEESVTNFNYLHHHRQCQHLQRHGDRIFQRW